MTSRSVVNFAEQLARFDAVWSPHIVARMNDTEFKLEKLEGAFVWHQHDDADETFIVLSGELTIELADGAVQLRAGELFVVPKGVQHRPVAMGLCQVLLVEPRGVVNTGEAGGERTKQATDWAGWRGLSWTARSARQSGSQIGRTQAVAFEPGRVLNEKLRVVRQLGAGGIGAVWEVGPMNDWLQHRPAG